MRKFVAMMMCVLACALFGCSGAQSAQSTVEEVKEELVPKALNEYSWEDLSKISAQISAADSDEAAREIAKKFGLVGEDGSLSGQTKMIVLNDTRALDVRVAGFRHDGKADGSGMTGITFMTVGAVDIRPMNAEASVEGGWEASDLRAWLSSELKSSLDKDLQDALVPVSKLTNNQGLADDVEAVTPTTDELWVFSVPEVCGDVSWDMEEYQQKRGYQDVDGMVNAEGSQYEVFEQAGVTGEGDPQGFLSLANSTGASAWWYRTPFPFDWQDKGDTGSNGYFFQVRDSGYPESLGSPEVPASVVVGFCV
ncbi:MAG: DUF6273 domain-containing protein [Coriobacteriales bacterium]|nr:DUF6273 domain-containing protein [Coriobacteriales bacterium]